MAEHANGNGSISDEVRAATSAVDLPPLSGGNGHTVPDDVKLRTAEVFAYGEEKLRALSSVLIERAQFAQQHGLTFGGKRNLYEILGYNPQLTNFEYGQRYARGGVAGRLVDVFPNATWRGAIDVVEDADPHKDTTFEKAWKDLDRQHQVQAKLLRVDKLSQLSTYACLLIGAGDAPLDTELPRGTPGKVLYLTPYLGGGGPGRGRTDTAARQGLTTAYDADISVYELDEDASSPRFGLPKTYQLRRVGAADPSLRPVHWTRVLHVAENLLWDDVYGLPALERVWNLLDDLDKVTGGGAEAFWLRANAGMHIDIDKDVSLGSPTERAANIADLKQQAEEYHHQLTRWLRTRGVEVKQLGSDVANFSSPADAILTQIAGSKGIPKRILTGSELGELASSQDRDNWKDQVNGRQTSYAGPYMVRPLVDRLIAYGYLPTPAKGPDVYEVKWPHVQVLTEEEKAAGAAKWAETNKTQGETVFPNDQIRAHWYGFEALTDEEKQLPLGAQPVAPVASVAPATEAQPPQLAAAEEELVRVLEAAIAAGNTEVIDEILGLARGA